MVTLTTRLDNTLTHACRQILESPNLQPDFSFPFNPRETGGTIGVTLSRIHCKFVFFVSIIFWGSVGSVLNTIIVPGPFLLYIKSAAWSQRYLGSSPNCFENRNRYRNRFRSLVRTGLWQDSVLQLFLGHGMAQWCREECWDYRQPGGRRFRGNCDRSSTQNKNR